MVYRFKDYKKPQILEHHLNLGGRDAAGNELDCNSLYFTKNGQPFIGIMGELHFSRVPKEQWRSSLERMKEGGITIVASYIIWAYHEQEEGQFNWSGQNDLRAFIKLAQEVGLMVCIRIGPWAHGEVRYGGFPDWLMARESEMKLRSLDENYLALVEKWYSAIAGQCQGLYFKDGGPITMCQVENELVDNADYLLACKKLAQKVGIDVPFFTVTGWNSAAGARIPVDEVIPMFGGYCDAPWDGGTDQLPPCPRYFFTGIRNDSAIGKDLIKAGADADGWQLPYENYPYCTCEIGGGLMNTYHRRYIIQGMDVYAMTMIILCEGSNLLGYYMYHGGVNQVAKDHTLQESKATGYPNDYPMISYDFQAPISSYGETRESYDLLNLLHMFVKDYDSRLAHMTYVEATDRLDIDDTSSLRYGMRTDGHSGFVFINHYQRLHELEDVTDVVIDTGSVVFPSIDVRGDICFFMPFNMQLSDDCVLEYATAQPLCRTPKGKWIFMKIPGITPEFKYAEGCTNKVEIVVIKMDQALCLRKVDGQIYYEDAPAKTYAELAVGADRDYSLTPLEGPAFEIPDMFAVELKYQDAPISWYEISVEDAEGFIDIDVKCDVMQLYADGQLVEDDFYHNMPWRVPKSLLYGHKCHLVCSQYQTWSYME